MAQAWRTPWVQMKYFSFNPAVYPNMLSAVSPDYASPGWHLVSISVVDPEAAAAADLEGP